MLNMEGWYIPYYWRTTEGKLSVLHKMALWAMERVDIFQHTCTHLSLVCAQIPYTPKNPHFRTPYGSCFIFLVIYYKVCVVGSFTLYPTLILQVSHVMLHRNIIGRMNKFEITDVLGNNVKHCFNLDDGYPIIYFPIHSQALETITIMPGPNKKWMSPPGECYHCIDLVWFLLERPRSSSLFHRWICHDNFNSVGS